MGSVITTKSAVHEPVALVQEHRYVVEDSPPSAQSRHSSKALVLQKKLWQDAYVKFKSDPANTKVVEKYEKVLGLNTNNSLDIKEKMEEMVKLKMDELKNKEWSLGNIIIRDQVNRILKVVQFAKAFGSTAATLDPVHAGLPWAAVCMILPVCV